MPKNDAILKNLKIHDRVQESPLLNSIMNQFIPVPTLIQYLYKIRFNITTYTS